MSGIVKRAKNVLRSFFGNVENKESLQQFSDLRPYKALSTWALFKTYSEYSLYRWSGLVPRSTQLLKLCQLTHTEGIFDWWVRKTMGPIFTVGSCTKSLEHLSQETQTPNTRYIYAYINEGKWGNNLTDFNFEENLEKYTDAIQTSAKVQGDHSIQINYEQLLHRPILLKLGAAQFWIRNIFRSPIGHISDVISGDKILAKLKDLHINYDINEFREFLKEFLQRDVLEDLSKEEITRFEWFNNVHSYYFANTERNQHPLIKSIAKLTPEELLRVEEFTLRIQKTLECAKKNKVEVVVESGSSLTQDAIDSITEQFSSEFNQEKVHLINTLQNYLKSSKQKVAYEIERTRNLGQPLGLKLEYGQYFNREWEMATRKNARFLPVYESKEESQRALETNSKELFRNLPDKSRLLYETHDKNTIDYVTKTAKLSGIKNMNEVINFYAQKGIGDYTLNYLIREGFRTYRILPYGKTETMTEHLGKIVEYLNRDSAVREAHIRFIVEELCIRLRLV